MENTCYSREFTSFRWEQVYKESCFSGVHRTLRIRSYLLSEYTWYSCIYILVYVSSYEFAYSHNRTLIIISQIRRNVINEFVAKLNELYKQNCRSYGISVPNHSLFVSSVCLIATRSVCINNCFCYGQQHTISLSQDTWRDIARVTGSGFYDLSVIGAQCYKTRHVPQLAQEILHQLLLEMEKVHTVMFYWYRCGWQSVYVN